MASNIKKKRLLSIVIKEELIRIVEVTRSARQMKLHSMFIVHTPAGAVNDGMIEKPAEVANVVRSALEMHGVNCRDVVFSLVSGKIATKEVLIPDVKESRIAEIINTNAAEYFPVNVEQYIIRYTVLEKVEENDEKKLRLQVAAVPCALVDTYYQLAELTGLRIETMDYAGNSSYQLLRQQITPEFCMVINIDSETTMVSIFENNVMKLQRTIPYGKAVLMRAVMDELGLDTEAEATQKLEEEKLLHISFDGDSVTESLKYLVSSINRITDYYISRNGSRRFDKAYIIGKATTIPGFVTLMSNELSTELIPIVSVQNMTVDENENNAKQNVVSYVQCIGALIEPLGIETTVQETKSSTAVNMRVLVLTLIASVAVAVLITVLPLLDVLSLESDIDKTKQHIKELSYVNKTVNEYYKAEDALKDMQKFAEMTEDNDDALHTFIEELEKKIPSDVSFRNMSVTSGAVTISGNAASKSSVAKLIQQLRTIDTVQNVYVSSESEVKDNSDVITVSFSLTCTFGDVTEVDE